MRELAKESVVPAFVAAFTYRIFLRAETTSSSALIEEEEEKVEEEQEQVVFIIFSKVSSLSISASPSCHNLVW